MSISFRSSDWYLLNKDLCERQVPQQDKTINYLTSSAVSVYHTHSKQQFDGTIGNFFLKLYSNHFKQVKLELKYNSISLTIFLIRQSCVTFDLS